jgi:Predicted Fe-S oxidoreductases
MEGHQSASSFASDPCVGGILHIHPTLQCNLTCLHCYSESSPRHREALAADDIIPLMESIRQYGYTVLSVSGGEPFLYKELSSVLMQAKLLGMQTQLVTNGILAESKIATESLPWLDLVAVSIDGDEKMHDEIRHMKGAYHKVIKGAETVVAAGKRLAVVSAIANGSWRKMTEVAEMAHDLGASFVQFHPLELSGRAIREIPNGLDLEDLHRAYIVFNYLQEKYAGIMHIQMDCLHRFVIETNPEICGYIDDAFIPTKTNFVRISRSVILDEKGNIMPFSYGLHPRYHIGNVKKKKSSEISAMLDDYFENRASTFSHLVSSSYKKYKTTTDDDNDLIVWSEYIVEQSRSSSIGNEVAVAV